MLATSDAMTLAVVCMDTNQPGPFPAVFVSNRADSAEASRLQTCCCFFAAMVTMGRLEVAPLSTAAFEVADREPPRSHVHLRRTCPPSTELH